MRKLAFALLLPLFGVPPVLAEESAEASPASSAVGDPARGETIYQANCAGCHNPNPRLPGPIGPDLAGASRALVEARVMRAEYPQGYAPKRASRVMVAMPHLAGELDHLHAYLTSL